MTAAFPGITLYIIMAVLIPSGRKSTSGYGHDNHYYKQNKYNEANRPRKEAEKVEDEDWVTSSVLFSTAYHEYIDVCHIGGSITK